MAKRTYTIELDDTDKNDRKLIDLIELYKRLRQNEHDIHAVLASHQSRNDLSHMPVVPEVRHDD